MVALAEKSDLVLEQLATRYRATPQEVELALDMAFPGKRQAQASLLERICSAYEDGYAHGLEDDDQQNPHHLEGPEGKAWCIGRRLGGEAFAGACEDA